MIWTKEYKTKYFKQYHIDHKEEHNQRAKRYYLDHKEDKERIEKVKEYRRRYNLKHFGAHIKRIKIMSSRARELERLYRRKHRRTLGRTLKEKLIMIVQGKIQCRSCPETDIRKLSFDHINGNGDEDRNRFLSSGGNFVVMRWKKYMIKHYLEEINRFPLQVLCRNCHELKSLANGDYIQNRYRKKQDQDQITLHNFIA